MNTAIPEGKILIQFDGMCMLCSHTVQFIMKADRKAKFLFQTLQSFTDNQAFDSVIVVDKDKTYFYFNAILKIGYELGGIYKLIVIFKILPPKWRQNIYLWVARNRYRWFGKRISCYLPSDEERKRFI